VQRIDLEHANAKRRWEQMGKPEYLSATMVDELNDVSRLKSEPLNLETMPDGYRVTIDIPPQGVAFIDLVH
jgi:xylan 1,4-beta-xylosidase